MASSTDTKVNLIVNKLPSYSMYKEVSAQISAAEDIVFIAPSAVVYKEELPGFGDGFVKKSGDTMSGALTVDVGSNWTTISGGSIVVGKEGAGLAGSVGNVQIGGSGGTEHAGGTGTLQVGGAGETGGSATVTIGGHGNSGASSGIGGSATVQIGGGGYYGGEGVLHVGGAGATKGHEGKGQITVAADGKGKLTIEHTGTSAETLTERIQRDALVVSLPLSGGSINGNLDITNESGSIVINNLGGESVPAHLTVDVDPTIQFETLTERIKRNAKTTFDNSKFTVSVNGASTTYAPSANSITTLAIRSLSTITVNGSDHSLTNNTGKIDIGSYLSSTHPASSLSATVGSMAYKNSADYYIKSEVNNVSSVLSNSISSTYAHKNNISVSYVKDATAKTYTIVLNADGHQTSIDAADFVKDGMVESAYYETSSSSIVIKFNTDSGKSDPIKIPVSSFVQTYTAGDGLNLNSNKFSLKINGSTLTANSSGVCVANSGISETQLANSAVTTAKIKDANVTYAKLSSDVTGAFVHVAGDTMTGGLTVKGMTKVGAASTGGGFTFETPTGESGATTHTIITDNNGSGTKVIYDHDGESISSGVFALKDDTYTKVDVDNALKNYVKNSGAQAISGDNASLEIGTDFNKTIISGSNLTTDNVNAACVEVGGDNRIILSSNAICGSMMLGSENVVSFAMGTFSSDVFPLKTDAAITSSISAISANGTKLTATNHVVNLGTVISSLSVNGKLQTVSNGAVNLSPVISSVTAGGANGTLKVNGSDVSVKGLQSAAYTPSTTYDLSGSAAAVQGNTTKTVKDLEDMINNKVTMRIWS